MSVPSVPKACSARGASRSTLVEVTVKHPSEHHDEERYLNALVPLTSTGKLLGITHFHQPENCGKSDFALHGHHYTHAFFTIGREADGNIVEIMLRPFKLWQLSNEFVFRLNSIPVGETRPPFDSNIIQFASGLDVVGSDVDGQLIISYGINDCKGANFALSMRKNQKC